MFFHRFVAFTSSSRCFPQWALVGEQWTSRNLTYRPITYWSCKELSTEIRIWTRKSFDRFFSGDISATSTAERVGNQKNKNRILTFPIKSYTTKLKQVSITNMFREFESCLDSTLEQIFCIFLFLYGASLFGILISQVREHEFDPISKTVVQGLEQKL